MFPSLPYNKTDRKKNWANKDPQNCLFFLYTDYVQSVEEAIYLYCAQEVFMETDPTIFLFTICAHPLEILSVATHDCLPNSCPEFDKG